MNPFDGHLEEFLQFSQDMAKEYIDEFDNPSDAVSSALKTWQTLVNISAGVEKDSEKSKRIRDTHICQAAFVMEQLFGVKVKVEGVDPGISKMHESMNGLAKAFQKVHESTEAMLLADLKKEEERIRKDKGLQSENKSSPFKGLQIQFAENWNRKFPITGNAFGKEVELDRSDKVDMMRSKDLPPSVVRCGGQMQLTDATGNEYWAYYFRAGETVSVVIDEIRYKEKK